MLASVTLCKVWTKAGRKRHGASLTFPESLPILGSSGAKELLASRPRAFTSYRSPVTPGGGTGTTVSVLSFVCRVPPRGAGFGATDNCGMHRSRPLPDFSDCLTRPFLRRYSIVDLNGNHPQPHQPMPNITRRQFLEDSILAAAAATASIPAPVTAAEPRAVSANDKITVAIIGCGIRGKQHAGELARLSDCEIAYVCDPDRDRAAEVAADLVARKRPEPKAVQDLRVIAI